MRIEGFYIEGFGHFADRNFGPFHTPVTVFYGPNEAGKSTLLAFLRCILFGFPMRLGAQHYPPTAGGRHSGRIAIVDQSGRHYTVHRIQGRGAGPVTVSNGSGDVHDESVLARLLGHHTEDVFKSIFAFTLDELHSDDLLKDESVNSQIYSAGMGVVRLPDALRAIKGKRDQQFLKGGNRHNVVRATESLKDINTKLSEVANNAKRYGELTARLEEIEKKRGQEVFTRKQLKSSLDHLRRLESGWGDWVDLVTAQENLEEIEVISNFPVNGVRRLEALEERIRGARKEYDAACGQVEVDQSRAKARIEHESILEHTNNIRFLERNREHFESAVRDLPLRESELRDREGLLKGTLKDIGPDWDNARLEGFDLSVAVRDEVSQFGDRLRKSEEELDRRIAALAQDEGRLRESIKAESVAKQDFEAARKPSVSKEQASELRATIRRSNSQFLELKAVRERLSLLQDQLNALADPSASGGRRTGQKIIAGFVAFVGLALLAGGFALGGTALVIGVVGGLTLVGISAYLYFLGTATRAAVDPLQASPLKNSLDRLEDERKELESALAKSKATLGLESVDNASLIAAEASLDEEEALMQEFNALRKTLDSTRESTKERRNSVEQSEEGAASAKAQLENIRNEWRGWLQARGLNVAYGPQIVEEIRGKVELGVDRIRDVRDWHQRIATMRESVSEYIHVVAPLASQFCISFDRNQPTSATVAADRLAKTYSDTESKVSKRHDAEEALAIASQRLKERQQDLQKAETELKELLRSGGANSSEEFRKREEACLLRKELEGGHRESLNRLQHICGPGKLLEDFKNELSRTDIQSIGDHARQVEEELDTVDTHLEELDTELGSNTSELRALSTEEESSSLRMKRDFLLEQLREHAREWAKYTLAERLLDEASTTFERERQPGVVRNAESFFSEITGGRYGQVTAPLGQKTIKVSGERELNKEPSALSRGTREQLFLSLRFGLVQELSQRTEPLPVIVDEVLVNFDPERALRAAKAFVQLSNTNQVFVFTCHPTVVENFQVAAKQLDSPDPMLIEIE